MQKVVQRTKNAARRAKARTEKQIDHVERGHAWSRAQNALAANRHNAALIKSARAARKEDWLRGPLAPRRDIADQSETYGSINVYNFQAPDRHPKNRLKWHPFMAGDRVMVMKGREKGKVGEVSVVREEKGVVEIRDVNVADVSLPDWLRQEDQGVKQEKIMSVPVGIPVEDVRLVYPLPDPETRVLRDVVIEELQPMRRAWDPVKKEADRGLRVVQGTNKIIPWPQESEPEYEDYESDTLRASVDDETFVHTLQNPPMPESVIDELRNKYSKFRTRHDWEFVQTREAEDARGEKRQELVKKMRTPVQEAADLRAKEKAANERELTDEQLARIGEVIAEERAKLASTLQQTER